jgi:hypothetical protein
MNWIGRVDELTQGRSSRGRRGGRDATGLEIPARDFHGSGILVGNWRRDNGTHRVGKVIRKVHCVLFGVETYSTKSQLEKNQQIHHRRNRGTKKGGNNPGTLIPF